MKRLWKHIPPCLSDVMGFQAVMTQTDGLGIIDDPGRYKPLSTVGVGDSLPMYMSMAAGKPMGMGSREGSYGGERGGSEGHGEHGGHGGRGEHGGWGEHGGRGEHSGRGEHGGSGGGRGGQGGRGSVPQVTDSGLRNEDIISGTEKKIVQAYENNRESNPKFVLLSNAPSSAMISSDLDSASIKINELGGIPAGVVKVYGDKDYLFGISMTFDSMAKMLLKSSDRQANAVNILGCNIVDWNEAAVETFAGMLQAQGITVLSKWGAKGMSYESICGASRAALNIVVNVSGIRAAQYMESEFGIPYIVGAPFGKNQCDQMISEIKNILAGGDCSRLQVGINKDKAADEAYDAVIIGEQLEANAIRNILLTRGFGNVRVISFYEMDKSCMEPGDKKVNSEDDLEAWTSIDSLKLIIGSPDCMLAVKKQVQWIKLPNSGMSMMEKIPLVNMVGEELDSWIGENL